MTGHTATGPDTLASPGFRQCLSMPPAHYLNLQMDEGSGLDAQLAKILLDYKTGRHQQAYKRLTLVKKEQGLEPGLMLLQQLDRVTEARAPLLIFELLFLLTGNQVPSADTIWRYVDTISCFDPDDAICHGAIYNTLILFALRGSDTATAEQLCAQADAAYARCGIGYLRGFVHLHLAYIQVCKGDLPGAAAAARRAADFFSATPDAACEGAMVEISRLWIEVESGGRLPSLAQLKPLKDTVSSGEFWPETYLVLAALVLRAAAEEDPGNALRHHSELEAVLRIRGMTQVLPAMQLLREDHRRRQITDLSVLRDHPGLTEGHVLLLLPDAETVLTNWGTEAANIPLAFDRMRAARSLMLGGRFLRDGRFDPAVPLIMEALDLIEAQGWGWLALRERETITLFCRECVARRRFVERARQVRDTLLARPDAGPSADPRPLELTSAEYGIVQRLYGLTSNKLLAREMGVSEAAVKFHLKNIYRKLGVHRRSDALTTAHARGWIAPPPAHRGL
ncbi:MAG: response regulator transcription factor [Devosia nanyangense]|uniref:Response regulator transcription factor n=1 Tax=Devosia nanyangense TaxID=1228055 RepID=A0A933NYL8_9HYPH|nr:response regulator transcription factor [Devosia nanyangense]